MEADIKTDQPSSKESDLAIDNEDVIEADPDTRKKWKVKMQR